MSRIKQTKKKILIILTFPGSPTFLIMACDGVTVNQSCPTTIRVVVVARKGWAMEERAKKRRVGNVSHEMAVMAA